MARVRSFVFSGAISRMELSPDTTHDGHIPSMTFIFTNVNLNHVRSGGRRPFVSSFLNSKLIFQAKLSPLVSATVQLESPLYGRPSVVYGASTR